MTQEDKHLLLQDICGRLPYGVRVKLNGRRETSNKLTIDWLYTYSRHIEDIKPYLRPMSSMTEEERTEYFLLKHRDNNREDNIILIDEASALIDWLNKKMFDYRGLISMGLGIDCTGLNIYNNEKSI